MARTYGAIYLAIWTDPDFLSLPAAEQRLYMYLLTQRKLNRAGLLEYSPRRWASAAADLTIEQVEAAVERLHRRRYAVLDRETNEILVRSFIRNDQTWKQPKVMAAAVEASREIESPMLRRVLLAELDRIPLHELSDEPGRRGAPSVRKQIAEYIAKMRQILGGQEPVVAAPLFDELGDAVPVPTQRAADTPPDTLSDTPADTHPDSPADGYPVPPGQRPGPSPAPAPAPAPAPGTVTVGQPGRSEAAALPAVDDPAERLTGGFWDTYGAGMVQKRAQVLDVVAQAVEQGCPAADLAAALDLVGLDGFPVTPGTLQTALRQLTRGRASQGRASTTDLRIAGIDDALVDEVKSFVYAGRP